MMNMSCIENWRNIDMMKRQDATNSLAFLEACLIKAKNENDEVMISGYNSAIRSLAKILAEQAELRDSDSYAFNKRLIGIESTQQMLCNMLNALNAQINAINARLMCLER
jgi:bisphosphoglycerate-dependent phosphoglycerate mutase